MARSGLIALSDGVRAYFAQNSVPALVTPVGWRYRSWNTGGPGGGSRVCFVPGKLDPSALTPPKIMDAGRLTQPRKAAPGPRMGGPMGGSGNPRPLRWWHRIVSVCVWGVDLTDTSNDELQLQATEDLVELTVQAMHNAIDPVDGVNVGLADIEWSECVWTVPPQDRGFGREWVGYFEHATPLFDATLDTTTPQPAIVRGTVT